MRYSVKQACNSGSYLHTQIVLKRAPGYNYGFGDFVSADFCYQSNTTGSDDIYTTVEDLFKFHLSITDNKLRSKELTKELFMPGMRPARYGYGRFNQNSRYTNFQKYVLFAGLAAGYKNILN